MAEKTTAISSIAEIQEAFFAVFDFVKKRDIRTGLIAIREILDVVIGQVEEKEKSNG